MQQFLVTIQLPDNFDPSLQDETTTQNIHELNREMIAAGIRLFAGGLYPASSAKSLRPQPDGTVLVSDGPYLEAKEHVGGFSIVQCAHLEEAMEWARKGAIACRMPIELREIFFRPPPEPNS